MGKDLLFISWTSRDGIGEELGKSFQDFFRSVFGNVLDTFFSKKDMIGHTDGWQSTLTKDKLSKTKYGIFLLSQDAINSEWVNFELGAIVANNVKTIRDSENRRIFPIRFTNELDKSKSPFNIYQIVDFTRDNIWEIVNLIAFEYPQLGNLKEVFETQWTILEKQVSKIQKRANESHNNLDLCDTKVNEDLNTTAKIDIHFFEVHYQKAFDEIFKLLNIDHFSEWAYSCAVAGGDAPLNVATYDNLRNAVKYIKSRPKHSEYSQWDSLLQNLGLLINDFCNVYNIHAELLNGNLWRIKRFYKISPFNPNYDVDAEAYNQYIFLISDLLFEIARLCNLILFRIREMYPDYKIELGVLYIDDSYSSPDLVYKESEISDAPYSGIEQYLDARLSRETHYGSKLGIGKDGYELKK